MALTHAQNIFIENAICHFIDEAADSKEQFSALLLSLRSAFNQTLPPSHDLFQLQKCIHLPKDSFQRLETYNPQRPITCGEVQVCILEIITQKLKTYAESLHVTLDDNNWPSETIKQTLANQVSFHLTFQSNPSQFDTTERPEQFTLPTDGCLYQANLALDGYTYSLQLHLTINIPDQEPIHKHKRLADLPDLDDNLDLDRQLDQFVESHLLAAMTEAKMRAAKLLMEHLILADIIDADYAFNATPAAKKLLTHTFYFYQISHYELFFARVSALKENQYDILIQPAVITLLKQNICTFEEALELQPATLRLLSNPIFLELLRQGKTSLYTLQCIPLPKIKYTCLPAIGHLITQTHLLLSQLHVLHALHVKLLTQETIYQLILKGHLTVHCLLSLSKQQLRRLNTPTIISRLQEQKLSQLMIQIITTPFYTKQLLQQPDKFERWKQASPDVLTHFLSHSIKRLVAKNILTLEHAGDYSEAGILKMTGDTMNQLLFDKDVTLAECLSLSPYTITLLESHSTLFLYFANDAKKAHLDDLSAILCARHLILELNALLTHHDNKKDALTNFQSNINNVMKQTSIPKEKLKPAIAKLFLLDLHDKLLKQSEQHPLTSIENYILSLLSNLRQRPLGMDLLNTLQRMTTLIDRIPNKHSYNIFTELPLLKNIKINEFNAALTEPSPSAYLREIFKTYS